MDIDILLHRIGASGVCIQYYRTVLKICLEQGCVPENVCRIASDRIPVSEDAIYGGIRTHARLLWDRGLELGLWYDTGPYVKPKHLLEEMLIVLCRK